MREAIFNGVAFILFGSLTIGSAVAGGPLLTFSAAASLIVALAGLTHIIWRN